jgi:hypothetical protein
VTPCTAAEYSIFVLKAYDINTVDIQKVGGTPVGIDVFFDQFEPYTRRICITGFAVIHGEGNTGRPAAFGGDSLA